MSNLGFIIPTHCSKKEHILSLNTCISNIRMFYPNNKIIIVNDDSTEDIVLYNNENVEIIDSIVKKGGEVNPYILYLENKYFDKAVIIHDGMYIKKKLENIDKIENVMFIWYFTNHRTDWCFIKEPKSEYNKSNNIETHDDLIIHCVKKYPFTEEFKEYTLSLYYYKLNWCGCFGIQSIITHNFLHKLESKTGIVTVFKNFNSRRLRMVGESLFSIACQFILGDEVFEKSFDGLYYDGIHPVKKSYGYCCDKTYFKKKSFNR